LKENVLQRCERGVSLLELTITFPVLLLLVVGIFELSQDLHRRQVVSDAAKEGCRIVAQIASTNPLTADDLSTGICVDNEVLPSCQDLAGGTFTQREVAKKRVCDHLMTSLNYSTNTQIDDNWNVDVKVNCDEDSFGKRIPLISVNIKETGQSCVFCNTRIANFKVRGEGTMALRYEG